MIRGVGSGRDDRGGSGSGGGEDGRVVWEGWVGGWTGGSDAKYIPSSTTCCDALALALAFAVAVAFAVATFHSVRGA